MCCVEQAVVLMAEIKKKSQMNGVQYDMKKKRRRWNSGKSSDFCLSVRPSFQEMRKIEKITMVDRNRKILSLPF